MSNTAFMIGFWLGYMVLWCIMAILCLLWMMYEQSMVRKFMTRFSLHDDYESWKAERNKRCKPFLKKEPL